MLLVGTDDGLVEPLGPTHVGHTGHTIDAVTIVDGGIWALSDGATLWYLPAGGTWETVAGLDESVATCLSIAGDLVLVGASEARLFQLDGDVLREVASFADAPGRETWFTPWGGPPDVRSIGLDGSVAYVNVHVGGVLCSADLESWKPTTDISADVHEVVTRAGSPGRAYVASAIGLGATVDGGRSWDFHTSGLHAVYCRAVAVGSDYLLISASQGPSGGQAAVYRWPLDGSEPLKKCEDGLPEWFAGNIDTFCLDAEGERCVIAAPDGSIYESANAGGSWSVVAEGLAGVRCAAYA